MKTLLTLFAFLYFSSLIYGQAGSKKTWKWKVLAEDEKPGEGSFSYPSLIQTGDGLLLATCSYHKGEGKKSIKYVVIDPSKITD